MTGKLIEAPTAVSWGDDRIDCFARLRERLDAAPLLERQVVEHVGRAGRSDGERAGRVASWGKRRLDIFARGPDGQLWHKWFDDGWKQWENLGQPMIGPIIERPAVRVVGQQAHRHLRPRAPTRSSGTSGSTTAGSNWEDLGGELHSAPCVSCVGRSSASTSFCNGPDDGALAQVVQRRQWSGWESLDGNFQDYPAAVSWGNERIDVFVRGPNNTLQHRYFKRLTQLRDRRGSQARARELRAIPRR